MIARSVGSKDMRWLTRLRRGGIRLAYSRRFALLGSGIVIASLCWPCFSRPERELLTTVRALPPSETPRVSRLPNMGAPSPFSTPDTVRLPQMRGLSLSATAGLLPETLQGLRSDTPGPLVREAPGESPLPSAAGEPLLPEAPGDPPLPSAPGEPLLPSAPGELPLPEALGKSRSDHMRQ